MTTAYNIIDVTGQDITWLSDNFEYNTATLNIETFDETKQGSYWIFISASVTPSDHGSVAGLDDTINFTLDVTNFC